MRRLVVAALVCGCAADADVVVDLGVIADYDTFHLGVCGDCTQDFPHAATVRFEQPGTAVIRVFGYMAGDRFGAVIERTSSLAVE